MDLLPAPPRRTAAFERAVVVGVTGLGGGLVAGRPDVALLGGALLAGVVLALAGRGARPGAVRVGVRHPQVVEQGAPTPVEVAVAAPGAELVTVRLPAGSGGPHAVTATLGGRADPLPQNGSDDVRGEDDDPAAPPGVHRRVVARLVLPGRGRVVLARPDVLALGADGLLRVGPVQAPEARAVVLPGHDPVVPLPLPARPAGIVGGHRTRRPGDGADLLDVREFRPGDRLHRIDWRVSARRGDLHVRRTTVDADADVLLVVDSRLDVGHAARDWARGTDRDLVGRGPAGSSLDLAVRAATSLAVAHLRHGDRVGLVDLGARSTWVRAATGRRQLLRLRVRLAALRGPAQGVAVVRRPERLPGGRVVVVLSAFLDAAAADVARDAARGGALVVAVDCLPDPVEPDTTTPLAAEALADVLAGRAERLEALRGTGVLVTRWDPALVGVRVARRAGRVR